MESPWVRAAEESWQAAELRAREATGTEETNGLSVPRENMGRRWRCPVGEA